MTDSPGMPARAAAGADDEEILVRISSPSLGVLKRFLDSNPLEVLRVILPAPPETVTTAVVLARRSVAARARGLPDLRVDTLAEPPKTSAEIPQVGRGNRFADPRVLPDGRGRFVP